MIHTVAEMEQHFLAICQKHDVVVRWCKRLHSSFSLREFEEITVSPIKSAISYAVAMHELGHVLGAHQGSRRVLVRESWAWRWARANAICWTERMEKTAQDSLEWYRGKSNYIDGNGGRRPDTNPSA